MDTEDVKKEILLRSKYYIHKQQPITGEMTDTIRRNVTRKGKVEGKVEINADKINLDPFHIN